MEKKLAEIYASVKEKYMSYFEIATEDLHFAECDKMAEELQAIRTVMKLLRRHK